jgi:DNA-binding response OmpR family regulator
MSTLAPVVVLIEDEMHISRFVQDALEEEGCQVHELPPVA